METPSVLDKPVRELINLIKEKRYSIGVVGLGYVGLPLLHTFHEQGYPVVGFDIDEEKIAAFEKGHSYIRHFSNEAFAHMGKSDRCSVTTDFSRISDVDAVMMCVPTPLDRHREPDMSFVEGTVREVAPYMRKGQLLILESTTWPGTTDELIRPLAEELSGLKAGRDFYLAYSPEREDPGNTEYNTSTIPKVIGGDGEAALRLTHTLYSAVISKVVPVSNTRTAEAVKLLENIFRSVNIALVNELKMVFQEMGIDVHEVIDAAATKPFGFMKFTPGPGLGGHCIPIDPFYLTWKAREFGLNTRFIELAGEVNTAMPAYVVDRVIKALNKHKKAINGSRILFIGLAYKPDVDDMRESPTFVLMDLCNKFGADVSYYDTYLPAITKTREHARWTGEKSVEWSREVIGSYDAVVIATHHSDINYKQLAEWSRLIIDTRNVYGNGTIPPNVVKA
ncbi:MAG: nucleotide sugar dehydrogenase [Balneolales bacterium]